MAIFLEEPRYRLGLLGFFTEPSWGRRVVVASLVLSGVDLLVAVVGVAAGGPPERLLHTVFLIAAAWILVGVFCRLWVTGAMWMFTQVFDWIAGGIPTLAGVTEMARRAYWIVFELWLIASLFLMLVWAGMAAIGRLDMGGS